MKELALITGASGGIGKELAYIHAQKGRDSLLVARSNDKLEAIKKDITATYQTAVDIFPADLTKNESAEKITQHISEKKYLVKYLINNAGFGGYGKFHERDWKKDEEMIHLNIRALTHLTRLLLPKMLENGEGRILNVSSTASFMPGPLQAVYYASKAYVTSFSHAIAEELKSTGITVTNLCPGPTDTGFVDASELSGSKLFSAKMTSAYSVARKGYKAMEKGKVEIITEPALWFAIKAIIPFIPQKVLTRIVHSLQKK